MINTRVGFGYDMHKLEEGSYIMLGGIRIDSNHTVVAHSDGDIVLHSLSDAIYGSLAAGDIGTHFPSNKENMNIDKLVEQYPNDMELGGKVREMYWENKKIQEAFIDKKAWIFESPDGGKTVTRRRMGDDYTKRELVNNINQLNLFDD